MRIAILTEHYPPDIGGLAISVERLTRGLTSQGVTVEVIAPSESLKPGRQTIHENGGVVLLRFGRQKKREDALTDWFELVAGRHAKQPFNLLHGYFLTGAAFVAVYAGKFLRIPVVISARGNDLDRAVFDPAKSAHILHALQHADAITANSKELVGKAESLSGGRNVTYIPNGVDPVLFSPPSVSSSASGPAVIGFVGEARAKKGLASLLLAFRLLQSHSESQLWLFGGVRNGPDSDLVAVFQKQNPSTIIKVVPYMEQEKLVEQYRAMNVFVMPSFRDGMPNAILEAMACERPVVASAVGGITDVITTGENGLLVAPGDVEALAEAIQSLLKDAALRRRLGAAARKTVLENFTLQRELNLNLDLYRSLG